MSALRYSRSDQKAESNKLKITAVDFKDLIILDRNKLLSDSSSNDLMALVTPQSTPPGGIFCSSIRCL